MTGKEIANQRVRLTKRLIQEALLELLKIRKINKISIRELCQTAGINRTTFYNHYGSQYDVLNEIAEDFIQSTALAIMEQLKEGKNILECLTNALEYIKAHLEFAKKMVGQDYYDLNMHITVPLPQFDAMILARLPADLPERKKYAMASYMQYGTLQLLKEWILSDCSEPAGEEAELVLDMITRLTRPDRKE